MAARLDTSPQSRLRAIASSLRLTDADVDEALAVSRGDATAAQTYLRSLVRRPGSLLTREDRIRKASLALARTPEALDILHMSLTRVLAQPNNEKLRKVNATQGAFKERVAAKTTAGVELLYAVGYEPMHGFLVLQRHDATLLTLAIDELTAARSTPAYEERKAAKAGEQARQQASAQDAAAAAARRAAYAAKLPKEPAVGDETRDSSICVIAIRLATKGGAEALPQEQPRIGMRNFDADNTLDDLVNYVRSLPGVPEGPITLENVTTRPARLLDPARQGSDSLYALDLWPRGQVQVRG